MYFSFSPLTYGISWACSVLIRSYTVEPRASGKWRSKPIESNTMTIKFEGIALPLACRVEQERSNAAEPIVAAADNHQIINQLTGVIQKMQKKNTSRSRCTKLAVARGNNASICPSATNWAINLQLLNNSIWKKLFEHILFGYKLTSFRWIA